MSQRRVAPTDFSDDVTYGVDVGDQLRQRSSIGRIRRHRNQVHLFDQDRNGVLETVNALSLILVERILIAYGECVEADRCRRHGRLVRRVCLADRNRHVEMIDALVVQVRDGEFARVLGFRADVSEPIAEAALAVGRFGGY